MIIDRTWNKREQKLTISYVDKQGNRQFYHKYLHHIKTYEYDPNGKYDTWNGKKCSAVYKDTSNYTPNEFDILEFMYELDKPMLDILHAQYFPKLYFFDIETEYSDEFPYPDKAEYKVTAISLVGPDMSCIVFGLHDLNEASKKLFRDRYMDFINNNEFAKNILKAQGHEPKVLYQYFDSEQDLLKHFFNIIMTKVSAIAGWNSYRFDWLYLVNRIKRLFGDGEATKMVKNGSPTHEIRMIQFEEMDGTRIRVMAPSHTLVLDYMELVKQYDYILRPYESYSLDWVGEHGVKANKIKYDGGLQQLYERDPEWYYFYNAVDSLIGMLIHKRLKCLESPCAVDSVTLVPLMAAMGQVALTTANVFEEFYKDNKKVVWDYDAIERNKAEYKGAFCGCVPGRYSYCVCDDYASLYPSQIITCNMSLENVHLNKIGPDSLGRYVVVPWSPEQLEEFKKDPNYFVTVNGNVYKNDKDYAFKRLQKRVKDNRAIYKYTGQKIDSELLVEIDRLIKEKENNI